MKLVCKQYNTYHENYVRVMETLREIYWESKRAPDTNTTAIKNPYRREFLKKKVSPTSYIEYSSSAAPARRDWPRWRS